MHLVITGFSGVWQFTMANPGHVTEMCLWERLTVREPDHQQIVGFLYQDVSHAHCWWFKTWRQGVSRGTQERENKED